MLLLRQTASRPICAVARYSLVAITPATESPSEELLRQAALPARAAADALHIATAACHRLDFLLTWNCRHIANATKRPLIERICRENGYQPPVLCTPDELTENGD